MQLSPLETDRLGDLAQDDHSLYEIFEFVRLHHPELTDDGVLSTGRELVAAWVSRKWLALAEDGVMREPAQSTDDLLPIIDRVGTSATRHFNGSPLVSLAPQAFADVEWLNRTV